MGEGSHAFFQQKAGQAESEASSGLRNAVIQA